MIAVACCFEIYLRYMVLWLYKDYGTILLVLSKAPTVPLSAKTAVTAKLSSCGGPRLPSILIFGHRSALTKGRQL